MIISYVFTSKSNVAFEKMIKMCIFIFSFQTQTHLFLLIFKKDEINNPAKNNFLIRKWSRVNNN